MRWKFSAKKPCRLRAWMRTTKDKEVCHLWSIDQESIGTDSQTSDHLQRKKTEAIERDLGLQTPIWTATELPRRVWVQIWGTRVRGATLANRFSSQLALLITSSAWAHSFKLQHTNNQDHHSFSLDSKFKPRRIQWVLQIWQTKTKMAWAESRLSKWWCMTLYHSHSINSLVKLTDIVTLQPTTTIHPDLLWRGPSNQIGTQILISTLTSMKNLGLIWITKTRLADHRSKVSNSKPSHRWWISRRLSNRLTTIECSLTVKHMTDRGSTVISLISTSLLVLKAASRRAISAKVRDSMIRGDRAHRSRARTSKAHQAWQMV